jgi:hypothetical protein
MDIIMVITACLAGECREHTYPLSPEVSLFQCNNQGQIGILQWKQERPKMADAVVQKYRCYTAQDYRVRYASHI